MAPQDKDRVRPYVVDGIEEYDNPMPRWWVGLFYMTIVFAVGYLVEYHVLGGPSLAEVHQNALDEEKAKRATEAQTASRGEGLAVKLHTSEAIAAGKEIFATNCAPCHGANGEGNIGPNLTDAFWLHGGKDEDVLKTIREGVGDKGMPPWGPVLGEQKVLQVAAFILSLQGSNPAGAKAPQGEKFERLQ